MEYEGSYCTSIFNTHITVYMQYTSSLVRSTYAITSSWWDVSRNNNIVTWGVKAADPVEIYWRATDLSLFKDSYASALATRLKLPFAPTAITTTPPAPTASPCSSAAVPGPTSSSSPSPLSPWAKAGIGLSAAFGTAVIALAILLLYKWRKCKTSDIEVPPQMDERPATQAPDNEKTDRAERHEWRTSELDSPLRNKTAMQTQKKSPQYNSVVQYLFNHRIHTRPTTRFPLPPINVATHTIHSTRCRTSHSSLSVPAVDVLR
jgi:hypothetical protein